MFVVLEFTLATLQETFTNRVLKGAFTNLSSPEAFTNHANELQLYPYIIIIDTALTMHHFK